MRHPPASSGRMLYGESDNVEYEPNPCGRIFGTEIVVRQ
jgi:hypothetical protein